MIGYKRIVTAICQSIVQRDCKHMVTLTLISKPGKWIPITRTQLCSLCSKPTMSHNLTVPPMQRFQLSQSRDRVRTLQANMSRIPVPEGSCRLDAHCLHQANWDLPTASSQLSVFSSPFLPYPTLSSVDSYTRNTKLAAQSSAAWRTSLNGQFLFACQDDICECIGHVISHHPDQFDVLILCNVNEHVTSHS